MINFTIKMIKRNLFHTQNRRTKWKRQNQLRLEQLRYQNSLGKESEPPQESVDVNLCCSPIGNLGKKYATCDFLTSAITNYSNNLSSYQHQKQNC